ncbi:hypothetical protein N7533_011004 [Penicillium manginii]|uniref:uncharacterized protein n=1 Tax=Penicillium manginii TaxID=203109 RepID=UPI002546A2A2|nr:uncharacterized protein N7533_011004 [Penicillium manginii]KAJ5741595.1 hypothetical protein N7533_011004 [Penicillium manginii]
MSRYSYQRLEPISEEITPADHQVFCLGGTSSNLERLHSRLQRAKRSSPDSKARMEESAYEISYLRAELHWHKETKQILLQLQENMYEIINSLDDALSRATARLHESEKQYLELWQTNSGDGDGGYF